jgi:hypothetical protein
MEIVLYILEVFAPDIKKHWPERDVLLAETQLSTLDCESRHFFATEKFTVEWDIR